MDGMQTLRTVCRGEVIIQTGVDGATEVETIGYATWFTAGMQSASLIMTSLMTS